MTDACRDRWYAPAGGGDPQDNDIVRLGFNACQCRHASEHIPFEELLLRFSGFQGLPACHLKMFGPGL
jgi:hypothetical protein